LFDIFVALASRESSLLGVRLGNRDGLCTVDEVGLVLSEKREFSHRSSEGGRDLVLVVYEGLPFTSGSGVTSEEVVGLKTHLTAKRTLNLSATRSKKEDYNRILKLTSP
jgi:hypothetical protein